MHYRVSVKGLTGNEYHDQERSRESAEMLFNTYANGLTAKMWESVTLSCWNEGAGTWHAIKEHVTDWHSSPLTHSYI